MKCLRLFQAARENLDAICAYTAPHEADHHTDELKSVCKSLVTGKKTSCLVAPRPGTFKKLAVAHTFGQPATLDVIGILHGRQDVSQHL